jgi:hypothetical protein
MTCRFSSLDDRQLLEADRIACLVTPESLAQGCFFYNRMSLQLEFTVEDPGAFTTPWKATITCLRSGNKEWYERVCAIVLL